MKRLFDVLFVMVVAVGVCAQEEEKKPESPFRIYLKDRTQENFISALEHYGADEDDPGSLIPLAYMHLIELEKHLAALEESRGELKNRTKFGYANVLLELGRYDEAIPLYDELNEKTPKWSCPWRHKGEAYWKKGDLDAAVAALEMAIETRETHYDAYVMLAEVQRDKKEYKTALATLEKGLTYYGKDIEDPEEEVSSIDVHFLYLDLLKKNGKTDSETYRKILEKAKKAAPEDKRLEECEM